MTVSVVFAIAGVIALLFGIIGGGIKAKEVEIPLLPINARVFTITVGLILLGITIWLESNKSLSNEPPNSSLSATILSPTVYLTSTLTNTPYPINTSTPALTQTSESTRAPTSSALEIQYSKLYQAKTWPLILQESFDNNDNQWDMWNIDDADKKETMQIENGVFQWGLQLRKPDTWYWEIAPLTSFSNFYYSVKVRRIGKPNEEQVNQAIWGIIFRRQGNDLYAFLLNDLHEYYLSLNSDGSWIDLVGQTKSSFVNSDKSNELAVIADGTEITLFINGTPIKTINDKTLLDGNVGFYAGLIYPDDEVKFEFDDFELRQKP